MFVLYPEYSVCIQDNPKETKYLKLMKYFECKYYILPLKLGHS